MEKCICIKDNSEEVRWNPFKNKINHGEIYFYEKHKIKFNNKTNRYKIVRPTQMGIFLYEIYDINENKVLEFSEEGFAEHFDTKTFKRNEIIDKILE